MSEKNNLNNNRTSSSTSHRPAGFGTRKASAAKPEAKPLRNSDQPAKRSAEKAKPQPKLKPNIKKSADTKAKPRKYLGPKDLLLAIICVVITVAIVVGVIMLLGKGRTVHQMPTILRITEEPTQKPAEIAMLPNTIHLVDSGAVPSPDGTCA